MFAVFAARAQHIHDIVVTGNLSTLPVGKKIFIDLERLCEQKFIIPENADFATAIGAAIYGRNDKEGKVC